jgi:hypothetical protein
LQPFASLNAAAWRFAAIACAIQILAVLFSLAAPVPINNRIAKMDANISSEGLEVSGK